MNSCLYGNGTSFVESLFEDFGRLTSTVASKSFNHYILFFHCTARKNANESVNRIQLCVISTVCVLPPDCSLHMLSVSPAEQKEEEEEEKEAETHPNKSVSVSAAPLSAVCLPAAPTPTPPFNSHLRLRRTRPRPSRPRPFPMTTTKRPFPWIPAPPLSTSPPT